MKENLTVVVVGHFLPEYLKYLKYLFHSLPNELLDCNFIIHFDNSDNYNDDEKTILDSYLKTLNINYVLDFGFGGLISSIEKSLSKIKTNYYIFLEHDWVFLKKDNIDFENLIRVFDNYHFVNSVWFSKDDNTIRGFEICEDITKRVTPFELEKRIKEINLVTTCRWSNNPVMFRTSKMKEWFESYIRNEHINKLNQRQSNVEEKMISVFREIISKNKWEDIKDDWGTYLYGNLNEGPYVGHTDASRRYQGQSKSQPEINGENYMKNFPNINSKMFSILNYNLADEGYFINLSKSTDRLQHVQKLINKYNIKNLNRFEALTDELHVFSCTKSHLQIFRESRQKNLQTIFVAEDDFNIEDLCYLPKNKIEFKSVLDLVYNDLQNVEWDVLLFGCNPKEDLIKVTENLYKVTRSTGAWAYLIKKRAYEYILQNSNYRRDYIAIDDYLPSLNEKGFTTLTTVPLLINHGVGFESTLQPRGPVNYDLWIQGNYHVFLYDKPEFNLKRVDPKKVAPQLKTIFK